MTTEQVHHPSAQAPWWQTTWTYDLDHLRRLAVALVAVIAVFALAGWVLTDVLAPNPVTEWDRDVAERFADGRTETLDAVAPWAAGLSDTHVKVIATAVIVLALLAGLRRWHEALFVVISLVFEATAFIVITFLVGRPRPSVEHLVDSPVDTSFPSGHVAAATVYGAFAVVVFWHTRATWIRALAVGATVAVVGTVAFARLYQGVHFASDVLAGIVLGLVSLAVCHRVLGPPPSGARPIDTPTEGSTDPDHRRSTV